MAKKSALGELRPKYDEAVFKNGVRGKYAKRYAAGTNIVRLSPDVAAAFPNDEAVDEALRFVLRVAADAGRITKNHGDSAQKTAKHRG